MFPTYLEFLSRTICHPIRYHTCLQSYCHYQGVLSGMMLSYAIPNISEMVEASDYQEAEVVARSERCAELANLIP